MPSKCTSADQKFERKRYGPRNDEILLFESAGEERSC